MIRGRVASRSMTRRHFITGLAAGVGALALGNGWLTVPTSLSSPLLSARRTFAADLELPARFHEVWSATDEAVKSGAISRTWFWGPEPRSIVMEPYDEAPGGQRIVAYYDKARMEDNSYRAQAPWDVSSGLLVKDMMEGRWQVGDNRYEQRSAANVNVAGDTNDPSGPTYATMQSLRDRPGAVDTVPIIERIDRTGLIGTDSAFAAYNVRYARYVPETDHTLASVFDDFIRQYSGAVYGNDFYVTGLPLTEPYWSSVRVGGSGVLVLIQAFERRVLTYTPINTPEWQVEMGNVGQQYLAWLAGGGGDPDGCTMEKPFPDQIGTASLGPVIVHNEGCKLGFVDNTSDSLNNFAAFNAMATLFYPGEQFEFWFYYAADQIAGEDRPIDWNAHIPGAPPGEKVLEWDEGTKTFIYRLSLPELDSFTQEQVEVVNAVVVADIMMAMHFKTESPRDKEPWEPDYAVYVKQFAVDPRLSGQHNYPLLLVQ